MAKRFTSSEPVPNVLALKESTTMKHEYIAPTSSLISIAPLEMLAESLTYSNELISNKESILSKKKEFEDEEDFDDSYWDE